MSHQTFAAWFTATVVVMRLLLWLRPTASPTVAGFRIHHWMTGAVLALAAAVLYATRPLRDVPPVAAVIAAIGSGLIVDEFTYLATGGRTHADNYSRRSLVGTALIVVALDALLLLSS